MVWGSKCKVHTVIGGKVASIAKVLKFDDGIYMVSLFSVTSVL